MEDYYKLYKFLFEDENYKGLSLNSKIAYTILLDIENNISNSEKYMYDENKKYLIGSREYVKDKLNVSINTVTKIYKELITANLIKEKITEVGKPNLVSINKLKTNEEDIHKNSENVDKSEEFKNCELQEIIEKEIERFTNEDIEKFSKDRNMIFLDNKKEKKYQKILNQIQINKFNENDRAMIKIALELIVKSTYKKDKKIRVNEIDYDIVKNAVEQCKKEIRHEKMIIGRTLIQSILDNLSMKL